MNERALPLILVAESLADDEVLTLRALRRVGIMAEVWIERAGDEALWRYREAHADRPPYLMIVSDDLLRLEASAFVQGVRALHGRSEAPILHLLASKDDLPCPGANDWAVKPIAYEEYIETVGSAARRLLGASGYLA